MQLLLCPVFNLVITKRTPDVLIFFPHILPSVQPRQSELLLLQIFLSLHILFTLICSNQFVFDPVVVTHQVYFLEGEYVHQ